MDIIFDIDGTLANGEHRQYYLDKKPKDWETYQFLSHLDAPHETVIKLCQNLYFFGHNRIIICSGRGEQEKEATEKWLSENKIFYNKLYLRKFKDYRPDDIIKEELLDQMLADGYNPKIVFDDRNRVVQMWRKHGLVCCQVAEGNF